MDLKFQEIAFYMSFVVKCELLWSSETLRGESDHYETTNHG